MYVPRRPGEQSASLTWGTMEEKHEVTQEGEWKVHLGGVTSTATTPANTLRIFCGVHSVLVPARLSGPPPYWFDDVDSRVRSSSCPSAIFPLRVGWE